MAGVFISHAAADKKYAEAFVDRIIKLGCALQPDEIFYSSGADTGVPSGEDLMSFVRRKVGSAELVIALITPTYQTRPVCIAELGAAWSRAGSLFPLLAPGMPRSDLEGVLPTQLIKYADDSSALDELKDRVGEVVGRSSKATTWGSNKTRWLVSVKQLATKLAVPGTVSVAKLAQLREEQSNSQSALDEAAAEIEELQSQIENLAQAKDASEVRAIRMPKGEKQRFNRLLNEAATALDEEAYVVRDAIWHEVGGHDMPWPDIYEDKHRHEIIEDKVKDGLLVDSDGFLLPNSRYRKVRRASEAVEALNDFLKDDRSVEFVDWFEDEYDVPMDLGNRLVWKALLED